MKYLSSLILAVCFATTTAVQGAEAEFGKNCALGLTMQKQIPTDCSVSWVSDNGKVYCFSNEDAKTEFLKDVGANVSKAEIFWSGRLGP